METMETNYTGWQSAEGFATDGPSPDFIRAVAELLETSPEDMLSELGYMRRDAGITSAHLSL